MATTPPTPIVPQAPIVPINGATGMVASQQAQSTFTSIQQIIAYLNGQASQPTSRQPVDVTSSRAYGTVYQNTNSNDMLVSGYGLNGGSSTCSTIVLVGENDPPNLQIWAESEGATISGGFAGFSFEVPAGWWYQVNKVGDITSLGKWFESVLS